MTSRVTQYKFDSANDNASRIGAAHIVFLFFLMLWMGKVGWMVEGRTVYCIISGVSITILHRFLDMKRPINITIIAFIYIVIVAIELLSLGMPPQLIEIDGKYISKGIMFEMILYILPLVYAGIRIAFVLTFIPLYVWSKKLSISLSR